MKLTCAVETIIAEVSRMLLHKCITDLEKDKTHCNVLWILAFKTLVWW
jgi:hypothetical protein